MRLSLFAPLVFAALAATPSNATAQDPLVDVPAWQEVISGQIDAFRHQDGPAALGYAASGFRNSFTDPRLFLVAIMQSGYTPIVESASHNFGSFKLDANETAATQLVMLMAPNQTLYEALYTVVREDDGWRISGVMLVREAGVGV